MKANRLVGSSFRAQRVFAALRAALGRGGRGRARVVHFSVQRDHVHLVVEADDRDALARGMQGLAVRLARAANGAIGRRGPVWAERYHARALTTPRSVRNALVYVLFNHRRHGHHAHVLDPCSSVAWFDGLAPLSRDLGDVMPARDGPPPVPPPRTWLARVGWRRHGLLAFHEGPRAPA